MPWHLEYLEWARCASLTFEGAASQYDLQESVPALIALLNQHGARKILTDFTDGSLVSVSAVEVSQLPNQYRDLGLKVAFFEALVAPRGGSMRSMAEYYETLCTNRGNTVRLFDTRADALNWLASIN